MVSVALTLGTAAIVSADAASRAPTTTVVRTIRDVDGDRRLERSRSDVRVLRDDLARVTADGDDPDAILVAAAGPRSTSTPPTPTRLLTFAHLSDMHVVDEESPLRMELVDFVLGRSYRPQDGLTPHVLERMVVAVRDAVSPVSGSRAEVAITTGDNTDTGQRNEIRWFIDLLDGGPVAPDSGVRGSCGLPATRDRYQGVRGTHGFYEPDASERHRDGRGYASSIDANRADVGLPVLAPDAPGLFEAMNEPFESSGLGIPWYSVFGNHDALVQGNLEPTPTLVELATGCRKVVGLSERTLDTIRETRGRTAVIDATYTAMVEAATGRGDEGVDLVEADPDRRPLTKGGFIAEHFRTRGTPIGHGFGRDAIATGHGHYSVSPAPGVRFLVLDSVNESGGHNGNIDAGQFRWVHDELLRAEDRRELVIAFAHHTLATLVERGPTAGGDRAEIHFGLGADASVIEPCPLSSRLDAPRPDETLRCLFLRHPGLVAFVNGHEHRNRIAAWRPDTHVARQGGFWEITTASHVEWPQQARLIDIYLDGTGGVLLYTTILDHASPPMPGTTRPRSVEDLASVARELAFNDPHARIGLPDTADPSGGPADRDTELRLTAPYPTPWIAAAEAS